MHFIVLIGFALRARHLLKDFSFMDIYVLKDSLSNHHLIYLLLEESRDFNDELTLVACFCTLLLSLRKLISSSVYR